MLCDFHVDITALSGGLLGKTACISREIYSTPSVVPWTLQRKPRPLPLGLELLLDASPAFSAHLISFITQFKPTNKRPSYSSPVPFASSLFDSSCTILKFSSSLRPSPPLHLNLSLPNPTGLCSNSASPANRSPVSPKSSDFSFLGLPCQT